MSDAKLIRYLKRPLRSGTIQGQLVILTDSKGKYLRNVQHTFPNFNIRFEGRSGLRLVQGLNWLQIHIKGLIEHYGLINLNVWLGTCDLTCKAQDNQLSLRYTEDDDCYRYVIRQIERYYQLTAQYSEVRLVFLQIPHTR